MNTYECMYILQTHLSDEETEKANRRIVEEIEKCGGTVVDRERLGKKRLAYSIRRQDDGVYHLMYFELPPGEVTSLRAAYRLHPRLLRFLILRKELEDVPKLQKRTPPEPEKPETVPGEGTEEEEPAEAAPQEPEAEPVTDEAEAEPRTEEAPAGAGLEAGPEKQE